MMQEDVAAMMQGYAAWLLRVTTSDNTLGNSPVSGLTPSPSPSEHTKIGQVLRELSSLTTIPKLPELEAEWTHCRKVELSFRQAGGIPPVVSLLSSSVDTETAATILGNVCALGNAQTGEPIRKAGGIEALATLLNSGTDSQQTQATFALCGLAVHPANQVPIRKAECIPQLVMLARTGTEVQKEHAVKAISYLTESPSNTVHIIGGGGIKLLVGLALEGRSDQSSADAALGLVLCALGNLATESIGRDSICEAGGIPPLIRLIRQGTESQKATRALRKLAETKANAVQICEAGAISPLVTLVKCGSEVQKEEAAYALAILAKDNNDASYQLQTEGGVSPLVDLLVSIICVGRDWEDNKYASEALANIACHSKTKSTVISGLVACLSPASSRYSVEQRSSVIDTLDYISEDANNIATIREQLRAADLELIDFTMPSLKLFLKWFGETKQGNRGVLLEKLQRTLSSRTGNALPSNQHQGSPAKKPRLDKVPAVPTGVENGDDSDDMPINAMLKNTTGIEPTNNTQPPATAQLPADNSQLSSPKINKRPAAPSNQSPAKQPKLLPAAVTTDEAVANRTAQAKAEYQAAVTAEKEAAAAAQKVAAEEATRVRAVQEAAAAANKAAIEQEARVAAQKAAHVQAEKEAAVAAAAAASEVAAGLKAIKEAATKRTAEAKAAYQAAVTTEKEAAMAIKKAAVEEAARVKALKETAAAEQKAAVEQDAIAAAQKAARVQADKEAAAAANKTAVTVAAHAKAVTEAAALRTAGAKAAYQAAQAAQKEAARVRAETEAATASNLVGNAPTTPALPTNGGVNADTSNAPAQSPVSPKPPPTAYALFKQAKTTQLQHLSFQERSKQTQAMWKSLDTTQKKQYQTEAARLKAEWTAVQPAISTISSISASTIFQHPQPSTPPAPALDGPARDIYWASLFVKDAQRDRLESTLNDLGFSNVSGCSDSQLREKMLELTYYGGICEVDWATTLKRCIEQCVHDFLCQFVQEDTARDKARALMEKCRSDYKSMWQQLISEYCPHLPAKPARAGQRIMVIGPGFGFLQNPAQIRMIERAGFDVKRLLLPNPEEAGFSMDKEIETLLNAIGSYQPAALLCASKGGAYMVKLWQLMETDKLANLPCMMINVHPHLNNLPEGVKVILVQGAKEQIWHLPRGYNQAGAVGFDVEAHTPVYTKTDANGKVTTHEGDTQYEFLACKRTLEGTVRTGSPRLCYLYHTVDETSGRAVKRHGDTHNPASLLKDDCLPRLVDALLSSNPPYTFPVSCASLIAPSRNAAERALGMDPATLRKYWWQSPGKKGTADEKRFNVAPGSAEFKHIETIFKAEPIDGVKRFYGFAGMDHTILHQIERIENGRQQEMFDAARSNIKNDLRKLGVVFESGKHSRWLFHGAANANVMDAIVTDNNTGFAPSLNARGLWGKGSYFARDAAYSAFFCDGCVDGNGFKMMLLCQVEVGIPCVGEPHMVHMPQVHPKRGERYHSFVDSASNPEMYIIEHAHQVYPAYIIHFA